MPRPRFKREPCDCLDCTDPLRPVVAADQAVRHAAALQDPPPKCLVIYVDGALLPAPQPNNAASYVTSLERAEHPHLDGLARDGCSSLLAVETPAAGDRAAALDRLAQLFGLDAAARAVADRPPDVAARYKQLAAALASTDGEAVELAGWAGFQRSMALAELVAGRREAQPALSDLPAPRAVAAAALDLLGLGGSGASPAVAAVEGEEVAEGDGVLDALLLHVAQEDGGASSQAAERFADACGRIEWLDAVVQQLNARPGVREGLLLTVVLGSGGMALPSPQPLLQGGSGGLRPRQSCELRADKPVSVDVSAPLLVVQRLPAVVRVDVCTQLSLGQGATCGGKGAILAEQLLPELAYKLGRASKYGA